MKTEMWLIAVAVLSVVSGEMVDLTHYNANNGTMTYPINTINYNMTVTHKGWWAAKTSIWLENDEFFMPSHAGTHMDAPSHFLKGGWPIDQIPLERLVSPAVVIDHSERAARDPNDGLQVADILAWEAKHGRIPNGAMVLSKSGWSKYYRNPDMYYGTKEPYKNWYGGLSFPGFSAEAANFLAYERNIYGVGSESLSIDVGKSVDFPAHVVLSAQSIILIENVGTGIHKLPPSGATVITLPIKNKGASGAPIRMLAYWGEDVKKFAGHMARAGPVAGCNNVKVSSLITVFGLIIARFCMKLA